MLKKYLDTKALIFRALPKVRIIPESGHPELYDLLLSIQNKRSLKLIYCAIYECPGWEYHVFTLFFKDFLYVYTSAKWFFTIVFNWFFI